MDRVYLGRWSFRLLLGILLATLALSLFLLLQPNLLLGLLSPTLAHSRPLRSPLLQKLVSAARVIPSATTVAHACHLRVQLLAQLLDALALRHGHHVVINVHPVLRTHPEISVNYHVHVARIRVRAASVGVDSLLFALALCRLFCLEFKYRLVVGRVKLETDSNMRLRQ